MYVCMYVCMYVFMYLCIYVFMYLCIYVSMYLYRHLCIYVSMYLCIYVSMYVCLSVSLSLSTCLPVCLSVCLTDRILSRSVPSLTGRPTMPWESTCGPQVIESRPVERPAGLPEPALQLFIKKSSVETMRGSNQESSRVKHPIAGFSSTRRSLQKQHRVRTGRTRATRQPTKHVQSPRNASAPHHRAGGTSPQGSDRHLQVL